MLVYSFLYVANSPLVEIVRVRYADAVGHCESKPTIIFYSMQELSTKIFYSLLFVLSYKCFYLAAMLMTVKEYAEHIGKSIPRVYQLIAAGDLPIESKYGKLLIKVRKKKITT